MKENDFIFADLSTYDVKGAKRFYSNIFEWNYSRQESYFTAYFKNKEVSGLYEMPQYFQDMNMPSFWMSYIQVENIDVTVQKSKSRGGIIELVTLESIGRIALIRDPLGAGFVVYEGDYLKSRFENITNTLVWNELFVSDFSKVKSFYQGIFNWTFEKNKNDRFYIKNTQNKKIGAIQQLSNDIKGKKEYWSVFFNVKDIQKTKNAVLKNNGSLLYEDDITIVLADPFGSFFHIVSSKSLADKAISNNRRTRFFKNFIYTGVIKPIKWKSILGLFLLFLSLMTNWLWIWNIFFAFWIILSLQSKTTYLLEPISSKENPFLYWIITILWILLFFYISTFYIQQFLELSGFNSDK